MTRTRKAWMTVMLMAALLVPALAVNCLAASPPADLTQQWLSRSVISGQPLYIVSRDQVCLGTYPGKSVLSAVFRYYGERKGLRVRAEVTDVYFSTQAPVDAPWLASCVELSVYAVGRQKITQFVIIPDGDARARVYPYRDINASATWKRTRKGYSINAFIPWKAIEGYSPGHRLLPVQAAINSKTPNGRVQATLTGQGNPWDQATFVGFRLK